MSTVKFLDLLTAQASAIGERRNAPHTKLRIQIEAAKQIQEFGYDKINISAICKGVELTRPGLYLHYSSKEDIVLDLFNSLIKVEAQLYPSLTNCKNLEEAIEKICHWYLHFHIDTGALFSTLTELRRTVPAAYTLWHKRSTDLLEAFVYQFKRFDEFHSVDLEWATFTIENTARAMNVTANRLQSHPGPITSLYLSDIDSLVKMFTRMMYQSMMGRHLAQQE